MNFSRFRTAFSNGDKSPNPSPLRKSVSSDDRTERSQSSQKSQSKSPQSSTSSRPTPPRSSSSRPQSWMPPPSTAGAQRLRRPSTSTVAPVIRTLPARVPEPRFFSPYSSPAVPDSVWNACDFLLGSGMVILQPSTDKVVLVYEPALNYWFLPKGRKDIGETLEQAALREAYEESGYRVDFLPLGIPTNSEPTPESPDEQTYLPPLVNTEPFYISTKAWWKRPQHPDGAAHVGDGVEYLTFWYIGYIGDEATREPNTGMLDEKNYQSHLLTYEEAIKKLEVNPLDRKLVHTAYGLLRATRERYEERQQAALRGAVDGANGVYGSTKGKGTVNGHR